MILKSIKSFRYAFRGIRLIFLNENNARIHLLATLVVSAAGIYFNIKSNEWLWILLSISLVWITEAINSAIEKLTDLISPEFNPKAGAIKDMAAGAVLIAAVFTLAVAAFIFIPYFLL